jgi:hypothetical protein
MPQSKRGRCRLCGSIEKLTKDHVPPFALQTWYKSEDRLYSEFVRGNGKPKFKQKGTYFCSLCPDCNNNVLGADYDKHLLEFCKLVSLHLRSTVHLSVHREISFQPFYVLRAVVGHLIAAREKSEPSGTDVILREFFYKQRDDLGQYSFYWWIYPYFGRSVMRDFGFVLPKARIAQLLKFFPCGFLIVDGSRISSLNCLDALLPAGPGDVKRAFFQINSIPPEFWPEDPNIAGPILFGDSGQDATISRPRLGK